MYAAMLIPGILRSESTDLNGPFGFPRVRVVVVPVATVFILRSDPLACVRSCWGHAAYRISRLLNISTWAPPLPA